MVKEDKARAFRLLHFPLPFLHLVAPFLRRRARVRTQHLATHARAARRELNPTRRRRARQRRGPRYRRRLIRHNARRPMPTQMQMQM